MIARRLGAAALAVGLIGGAWLIRDRVIEDDASADGPPREAHQIVCVSDLETACAALDRERDDVSVRIEDAAVTLAATAGLEDASGAPVWVTMAPLPAMVDDLRDAARRAPLETTQSDIASSPIALVVPVDRAAVLAKRCGAPAIEWECLGDVAGEPWSDIDGAGLPGNVRPAFTPIDTALGLLGVADAVAGYFGTAPIVVDDPDFVSWARPLARAVSESALSSGSAIATIQTRRSALDVAVGAEAELSDTSGSTFALAYADPMIRADVVVAVPAGTSLPGDLVDDLAELLRAERWDPPSADPNPLPGARDLLAIRAAWKEFT
ncbi:MAG: hypothetical protein ACRDZZ_09955 [Ilumatobacteraceae bacterium]